MKLKTLFLGLLAVSVITFSCQKTNNPTMFTVSGNADGAQETPPVMTKATGSLTGTYDMNTHMLTYVIAWNSLSGNPVAMHFHGPAVPGVPAGVQIPIPGFPMTPSGTVSGTATLTDAQQADLLAGWWYYNIHTPAHPAGEIRGQIMVK